MVDENDVAAADFNPNPNPSPNPSPTLTLTPFLTPILNPSLYTRITLQRLVPAPCAGFRLATLSDLPQLLELEAQWDSEFLRSSEATLRQRVELEPSGQFVAFGGDGTLLAAMYTQRVASLEVVQHGPSVPARSRPRDDRTREAHPLLKAALWARKESSHRCFREAAAVLCSLAQAADFHNLRLSRCCVKRCGGRRRCCTRRAGQ